MTIFFLLSANMERAVITTGEAVLALDMAGTSAEAVKGMDKTMTNRTSAA
jgi:hypothetical protein